MVGCAFAVSTSSDIQVRSIKVDNFAKLKDDKPLRFRDDAIQIYSDADGSLTIEADASVKLVNPENQADGTLSGTPLLVKIYIGATPYFFKIYPTVT